MAKTRNTAALSLQRRNEIKKWLLEEKTLTVAALSNRFNVTYETIRRDLEILEKEGFLKKVYGGAALNERVQNKVDFSTLVELFSESKQLIAKKAAQFIRENDCIFLDSSTTAYHLAAEITDSNLTVMSNSLKVLSKLSEYPSINVTGVGGTLDRINYSFLGASACAQLANFHLDKAFISCSALDMTYGLSDKYEEVGILHKTVMKNSNEVFLIVDHTKFNKVAFSIFENFEKVKAIITDQKPSIAWCNFLAENDILCY